MATEDQRTSPVEFLRLVADPVRWTLLFELGRSDRRVNELTELAGKPQNLVSYHLRELRKAGLVSARRSSADGRDTYYRANLDRWAQLLCATGTALHPGLRLEFQSPENVDLGTRRTPKILFLCTGNSARSQMAEALLEERSGHTVQARSAGSHPKQLHPHAVRVMAERGIDIAGRRTKHHRLFARERFDGIITLCDRVREICPRFPHDPVRSHWSMPDPSLAGDSDEVTYPAFARAAHELESRIGFLLPQFHPIANHKEQSHA